MISGLRWLALEVKYLERAGRFYTDHLDLPVVEERSDELRLEAGETQLHLRRPSGVPRGGLHTHYAFSVPRDSYAGWYDRLAADFDVVEHDFGSAKSLYFDDPDGHCVELGQADGRGTDLADIFEVVLEVTDLERAEAFYEALGMEPYDRGSERRRVRLDAGSVDVELWEPQLGIADARGGVHVDVGFRTDSPDEAALSVADEACAMERRGDAIRVLDPDGHFLTFSP